MPRYRSVRADGITFLFAYDEDDPSLLHMYARHLTTVDDALKAWFDMGAEDVWNDEYQRFEVQTETHVVYWTWLKDGERVLIITCFTRED